jgi:hypothetical protein
VSVANPFNLGHSNEKKGVSVMKGLIPRHSTKKRFVSVANPFNLSHSNEKKDVSDVKG